MRSEGEGRLLGLRLAGGRAGRDAGGGGRTGETTSDHRAGAEQMGGARNRQALCSATEPDAKDKFHYSCIYI